MGAQPGGALRKLQVLGNAGQPRGEAALPTSVNVGRYPGLSRRGLSEL